MTEETVCIGLARVSSETQKIVSGTLKELKDIGKFNQFIPHSHKLLHGPISGPEKRLMQIRFKF